MSSRVDRGGLGTQSAGEDPLFYYTRVFCRFLQTVFSQFDRGYYRWVPDELNTEITITDQATIGRESVETRPCIILSRGPASTSNIAIDQLQTNLLTGDRRVHTDLISSTMTYNVMSKEGLEAQRLAWQCARFTRAYKRTLTKMGMHRVGEDIQIGAESPPGALIAPESDNEVTLVPVSVPFYFQDFWAVEPVDKNLLTRVGVTITSSTGGTTPVLRQPSVDGRPLDVAVRTRMDGK